MRIYLSALGWVPEKPTGNRLRWFYPVDAIKNDLYRGFPEKIIVERAFLDEDIPLQSFSAAAMPNFLPTVPNSWWDNHGDVHPAGMMLPKKFQFQNSIQGVRFTYQGPGTLLRMLDPAGEIIFSRLVQNSDVIIFQASEIGSIQVFAFNTTLKDLKALDLFRNRNLAWEEIAKISVADTVDFSLAEAAKRYNLRPTLDTNEWGEFVEAARKAIASSPYEDSSLDEPPMWKAFQLLMGIRWEYAVLFGHGFFDGPHVTAPESDWINHDLILNDYPSSAVVYRVREPRKNNASCVAVCPPREIDPLLTPGIPVYEIPKVRLTYESNPQNPDIDSPKFVASYKIRWSQMDPLALGVEIEEVIQTPGMNSDMAISNYTCRTHQADDRDLEGMIVRSQDVPFHNSQLRCKARAVDGWDRVSSETAWSSWTSLELEHYPMPPNFIEAIWQNGTAKLTQQKSDDTYPGWIPDIVIENDPGAKVFVYRRKIGSAGIPAFIDVNVQTPDLIEGSHYKVKVEGLSDLSKFDGGYLIQAPFKQQITGVSGNTLYFDVSPGGDGTSFSAGKVKLQQNPLYLTLWDKVAEFNANNLPDTLVFSDNVPLVGERADVLSYHARVIYLGGKIGPPSNTVQALRTPTVPDIPEPFSVEQIGVDYYNRTMIKITFTQPVNDGKYTVWWAKGDYSSTGEFEEKAVQGVLQAQAAYKNLYLYDILAIPLPQTISRKITIGIQSVNSGGAQSRFETVVVNLPPMQP